MKKNTIPTCLVLVLFFLTTALSACQTPQVVSLSGSGWKIWLDKTANWQNEQIFAPPVTLSEIPTNQPSGGWLALDSTGKPAAVPGTVEEYFGDGSGPDTSLQGVSWWYRDVQIPDYPEGHKVIIDFEHCTLRAEVYLDGNLVGYHLVGGTPFQADITDLVTPNSTHKLAVRITNPGGTYSYDDTDAIQWGETDQYILKYHAFSGITGRVNLEIKNPVFIEDLYLQNTPKLTKVNAIITVDNTTGKTQRNDITVNVTDAKTKELLFTKTLTNVRLDTGHSAHTVVISAPDAKLWDTDNPNLYHCSVSLQNGEQATDSQTKRFGFRWFDVDGIGTNAIFKLNGKRIVLRSAISWSFWPVNGVYPSEDLAEKQIQTAKDLGMNMLHFHRCIGQPVVFEKADEMGLLFYEEPGGYTSGGNKKVGQDMARAKLLSMVKRDRSHPSLVIYNMINEQWPKYVRTDPALLEKHKQDLIDAHAIDPSRIITYTSSWAEPKVSQEAKLHCLPFDDTVYDNGWFDFHRAMGPGSWEERFYKSPTDQYNHIDNPGEIVFWGEDGAMSAPPRLGLIRQQIEKQPTPGWDSAVYLKWYDIMDEYLTQHDFRSIWPDVDTFCSALGQPSIEHQGKKIELARISDTTDAYTINGWEAQLINNHSGVVDIYRNPKSDPQIMAWYNRPLHLAVMLPQQVFELPATASVDIHIANEVNLKGPATLAVSVKNAQGKKIFEKYQPIRITGGIKYGELLAQNITFELESAGMHTIEAELIDTVTKEPLVIGKNELLAVDLNTTELTGTGAVYAFNNKVQKFLKDTQGIDVPSFDSSMKPLDWIIIARAMNNHPYTVESQYFCDKRGRPAPVDVTFFERNNFHDKLTDRKDSAIDTVWIEGVPPHKDISNISYYSARWEGHILPPITGEYEFAVRVGKRNTAKLWIDGKQVITHKGPATRKSEQTHPIKITLTAGKPVAIKVESYQERFPAGVKLLWSPPGRTRVPTEEFIRRCKEDGTDLIIVDDAKSWADPVAKAAGIKLGKPFDLRENWIGGKFFVRQHPLFKQLPTNITMDWPYQTLLYQDCQRYGLKLNKGDVIVGAWHSLNCQMGTAVSILELGKGNVILSTLDIIRSLPLKDGPSAVARKILLNYIEYSDNDGTSSP